MDIKCWNGDAIECMKNIPDKSIRFALLDLPYALTQNKLDVRIPFEPMWEQLNRIMMHDGTMAFYCQGLFFVDLVNSNRKMFRYDLVWDKILTGSPLMAKIQPLRRHEQIAIFYKKVGVYNPQFTEGKPLHSKGHSFVNKEPTNRNYGKIKNTPDTRKGSTQKYPTSIIRFQKPHPSKALSATEKSVEANEWLIKTYSNEGDTVIDISSGSFTTGIACVNTNRNCILIEKDEQEFTKGKNRLFSMPYFINK